MKTNRLFILASCAVAGLVACGTVVGADGADSGQPAGTDAPAPSAEASAEITTDAPQAAPAETLALAPGQAEVIGSNVNVRGQPTIKSEVVGRVDTGDAVMIQDVIMRQNADEGDPSVWAKISYPEGSNPWVHAGYIDPSDQTVKASRLNVRSGPGENYSVVGMLERGEKVTQVASKDSWIQIQAPATAFAFVAAKFLKQESATPVVAEATETATAEEETEAAAGEAVETVAIEEPEKIAEETTTETAMTDSTEEQTTPPPSEPTAVADEQELILPPIEQPKEVTEPETPPAPRIVQREGIVKSFTSIQAPSNYKLISPHNKKSINYLYSPSTSLDLSRYVGLRIIVTGEESLDRRWPNMPVLTIKRIYVVE